MNSQSDFYLRIDFLKDCLTFVYYALPRGSVHDGGDVTSDLSMLNVALRPQKP